MTPEYISESRQGASPQTLHEFNGPHQAAVRGFAQTYGFVPGMVLLTFVFDCMLNAGEIGTMGLLIPLSIAVSVVLGVITFLAQRKYYGDDVEAALIKALILATLTAIPTALPAFLYVPAGIVGLFRSKER